MTEKESTYVAESKKRVEEPAEKFKKYFCVACVSQVNSYFQKIVTEATVNIIYSDERIVTYFSFGIAKRINELLYEGYTLITFDEFETRFKPYNELAKYEGRVFTFTEENVLDCEICKGQVWILDRLVDTIKTEAQYIQLYELLTGKEFREEDLK
jgi:hypothetical protein